MSLVRQQRYELALAEFKSAGALEKPAHEVVIAKPFYMGIHEVTQEQYEAVMGSNPSVYKGSDRPVDTVCWRDAKAFVKKLSDLSGRWVRLPREADWEYACRAGSVTAFHTGYSESQLTKVGWYKGNSGGRTHPVGLKLPNAYGLYDMHGTR